MHFFYYHNKPKTMKKLTRILLFVSAICLVMNGCKSPVSEQHFIDLKDIDSTVRPQDDFFQYVNGTWLATTEIPATESGWGSFYILYEKSTQDLQLLLKELAAGKKFRKGSMEQLTADLYKSGMDSLKIEELGIKPLEDDLSIIAALKSPEEIIPEMCREITSGKAPLAAGLFPVHVLGFYVYQDEKNSENVVAHFDQGNLGLPTNEYYLKTDSASVEIQKKYIDLLKDYFVLLKVDEQEAKEKAERVFVLEAKLAKASKTPVELRDALANYHKFSVAQLDSMMPKMVWGKIITDLGIETDSVVMGQPEFYLAFNDLIFSEPLDVWKDALTAALVRSNAGALSNAFVENQFDFYGRTLNGQKEMKPRWKRLSQTVNNELRDALGKVYVDRFFPPEAKLRMEGLVDNLVASYAERIQAAVWMSDSTKVRALEKLHAITRKIGYPDSWDSYDDVEIESGSYLANLISTRTHGYNKMIARLGKPVDPNVWLMTPSTVNAYYTSSTNEIVFPAGILQPPFFNKDADDAVNYGAIGVVIAHEVTHGFDDQGRMFDAKGNMNEWWTKEDAEKYKAQAAAIIEQFNQYVVLDGLHVNGELTQGENIADLGGLTIAYNAFKKTDQGKSNEMIDGFTPDQRFFMSYAKVWLTKTTDESMRQQVLTDPHPPEKLRVNGPLSNMPEFYAAFNVKEGDALYKPDSLHVKIW
jgi:putative endopeptidase